MPPLNFDEARQVGNVAVHAVNAFDDDQNSFVAAALFVEQVIQRLPVVVRKRKTACARQDAALMHAVVAKGIVQDQIVRAAKRTNRSYVGGMAANVNDAIFGADHFGQLNLELPVKRTF